MVQMKDSRLCNEVDEMTTVITMLVRDVKYVNTCMSYN